MLKSNEIKKIDAYFWDQKYQNQETGWDIGTISEPLKCYIDQLEDKNIYSPHFIPQLENVSKFLKSKYNTI
jgi:hypothetical protein